MSKRGNPQGIHRLTATAVRMATKPGWHSDGGGLFLEVDASGRKRWAMRLTINGRRRDFGLGPIHKVSLESVRKTAAEYRAKAYAGTDPIADKRRIQVVPAPPTFEQVATKVHAERRSAWSNGKHVDQWLNTLRDHAFPHIGELPISSIGTAEVLKVLSPIWNEKPETARRVRQRLGTVLDWARVAGLRSGDNPVELLGDALPRHRKVIEHHAALPYSEVPEFVRRLRAGTSEPISKLAFEFLILTAARTKEVRGALWQEIDFDERLWTIPGHDEKTGRRMKAGREHIVPLSDRCIEILKSAKAIVGTNLLIFPDHLTGRMTSENRFLVARDSVGYTKEQCTPHGFRSSFRDWAAEETTFPAEVVEMALAHTIKNKTEAAYRRGRLLLKRRELMHAWSHYIC